MMVLGVYARSAALFGLACGASLQPVADFGQNPTKINMHIYVPDKLANSPAVVVAMHGCGGTAQQLFGGTKLPSYADQLGFVLVYPSTPHMSSCWDVQNPASLTHGQGGDALGIVNMVDYAVTRYKGDRTKVYVLGSSSGAMMTNVLAGSYPDVFEAGAAYSGVAFACPFGMAAATPADKNQTCAQGLTHTPKEWGDYVRNAYPSYAGRRTRIMIWHGNADTLVRPACAHEALKQWSNVLGLEISQNKTGVPSAAYTQTIYGNGTQLQGFFGDGVGHTAPVNEEYMLKFFGILS